MKDRSKDIIGNAAESDKEMGNMEERLCNAEYNKSIQPNATGGPEWRRNAEAPIPQQEVAENFLAVTNVTNLKIQKANKSWGGYKEMHT